MTKNQLCKNLIAELSKRFNIKAPSIRIGSCPRAVNGHYVSYNSWIIIDSYLTLNQIPDTVRHEFSHHLDYIRNGFTTEPPMTLIEVKEKTDEDFKIKILAD